MARHDADIVRGVEALQARLRASGATARADDLADAITGGATGTEILYRLTGALDGVRRDRVAVARADRRAAARLRRAAIRRVRRL